jgi:hypothetical protein
MILVIEWGRPNRIARLLSSVVTNLDNTVRSETGPSWFCSGDQTQFFKDSLFSSVMKSYAVACWRVAPCILVCGYQQFGGTYSLEHLSSYFLDFSNRLPDCTKKNTLWSSLWGVWSCCILYTPSRKAVPVINELITTPSIHVWECRWSTSIRNFDIRQISWTLRPLYPWTERRSRGLLLYIPDISVSDLYAKFSCTRWACLCHSLVHLKQVPE